MSKMRRTSKFNVRRNKPSSGEGEDFIGVCPTEEPIPTEAKFTLLEHKIKPTRIIGDRYEIIEVLTVPEGCNEFSRDGGNILGEK